MNRPYMVVFDAKENDTRINRVSFVYYDIMPDGQDLSCVVDYFAVNHGQDNIVIVIKCYEVRALTCVY